MRILSITAGAAGMYCGSCIRDNALAAELIAQGHDVTLVPLYTPTQTDEPNVSSERVFFGGISVYLEQHSALFRRTPRLLDRLWDSAMALKLASRRSIPTDPRFLGEMTVSVLRGEKGFQGKEIRKLLNWLEREPTPDVINLPNALLIALARPLGRTLGSPVCCTLQGEDLFLEGILEPYRSQAKELIRANLDYVDTFLPVSEFYAGFMSAYLGIPREKMQVVPLGINLAGYEVVPRPQQFTIGYFARVAPEKGLHLLCEAYRRLRERSDLQSARLEAAGYLAPEHSGYLETVERRMLETGLADEFRYRGVLDRDAKIRFLQSLSVLSVPCTYDEPKGMFLLEVMACGVPVVQPRRGAFPEIIEKTGGGILVAPDDPEALAEGILSLYREPWLAEQLGRNGAQGIREHYSAAVMARRALEVYRQVAGAAARNRTIAALAPERER